MKLIIDIPDYNLDDIQNGSIACGQILKAVKNGIPYEERPQGEWLKIGEIGLAYKCNRNRCGEVAVVPTKFCPNCGARMKIGGAENEIR